MNCFCYDSNKNLNNWLSHSRCLSKDYEGLAETGESVVYISHFKKDKVTFNQKEMTMIENVVKKIVWLGHDAFRIDADKIIYIRNFIPKKTVGWDLLLKLKAYGFIMPVMLILYPK